MVQPVPTPRSFAPARWAIPALLLLAGVVLFLWYAPETSPVAAPSMLERLP